jgi:hypothetical protein
MEAGMDARDKLELTVTKWLAIRAEGRLAIVTAAFLVLCLTVLGVAAMLWRGGI